MPQSAEEATRFTSTTPQAPYVLKNGDPRKLAPRIPGPPGETPQDKVRRLKAAAEKARQARISGLDRWIVRGRVWADIAHTITTTTLIAASFIAGCVTIYATTDMIIYNRRKKAQFFEEQKEKAKLAVDMAHGAIQDGKATEEHINLIKMEEEHQASLRAEGLKKGIFSRGKEWLFSGLKLDEEKDFDNKSLLNKVTSPEGQPNTVATISGESKYITLTAKQAFGLEKERQKSKDSHNQTSSMLENNDEQGTSTSGWISWILRR